MFRTPPLFSGLRRFVYLVQRGAGRRAMLVYATTGYHFNMTTNLENKQQQCAFSYKIHQNQPKNYLLFDVSTSIRGLHQKKLVLGLLLPVLGATS